MGDGLLKSAVNYEGIATLLRLAIPHQKFWTRRKGLRRGGRGSGGGKCHGGKCHAIRPARRLLGEAQPLGLAEQPLMGHVDGQARLRQARSKAAMRATCTLFVNAGNCGTRVDIRWSFASLLRRIPECKSDCDKPKPDSDQPEDHLLWAAGLRGPRRRRNRFSGDRVRDALDDHQRPYANEDRGADEHRAVWLMGLLHPSIVVAQGGTCLLRLVTGSRESGGTWREPSIIVCP